ncbi:nuclear transport factor 2 family protein [Tenacibaculum piscium]|uniref:nuclear transport factor 2 family protein n=1 Tax=Tenacibaculum piscium TaxID=1458515 RepID=UPI001F31DC51|nr:nuclear transport factor 2 family protein [Tenacibaculum piscium]
MKKILLYTILLVSMISCQVASEKQEEKQEESDKNNKKDILNVLKMQEKAWSKHDLEGYMQGYWKNDSLKFYGSNGLTYGWNKTLENYKKGYPTKEDTGILKFKINDVSKINDNSYFVMGAYYLTRKTGNANGVFMIIFKKINEEWKIIADTSC